MENQDFNNAQFVVEDLLDFPNDDVMLEAGEGVHSGDSSTDVNTVVDSCNSSFSGDVAGRGLTDSHFSSDLCVPYDDMAELEWLSNFEEESFSTEDLQNLQIISGIKPRTNEQSSQIRAEEDQNNPTLFPPEVSVPGKARSKRSRIAPGNWTSRLLALTSGPEPDRQLQFPLPESDFHPTTGKKMVAAKKKDSGENNSSGGDGRRCLHCATDKTPQWRTGPMGPKTLCNACGVRYKSGRLVPEYRPAASPTFVLTKHSNSHRKVMELRRQKEVHHHHHHPHHHHQQFINSHGMMFDVPNSDDYLIHQHIGPDFRQLI